MISPQDIHSLSDFQRNAKKHIKNLKKTKRPAVLTVNGKAALVVQDVKSYEELGERLRKVEDLEALREAIQEMEEGKGRPLAEAAADWMRRAAQLSRSRGRKSA